ncbi:MAG: DNA ligase [Pseudonocardiales bacterium]|nr:MAG: DNA ligase [Pseudonocardiales bacterium]
MSMAKGDLSEYRRKRDATKTSEPVPAAAPRRRKRTSGVEFVVQEHHASALHWDFRLERDGVLVSWAVPKGLPPDPKVNHLAVQTEDHPLEYATFEGTIAAGEYGGGTVTIWDHGTYDLEKWTEREVKVVLHGERVQGRFALFKTGKNWMIHRMDAPAKPDWQRLPDLVKPMLATPGTLPPPEHEQGWAYEMKWDGVRAVVYVDGGRARAMSRNDIDMTVSYPELRALGLALGTTQVVLDGELVAFDAQGRPSFSALQQRMHVADAAAARRLATRVPVVYVIFDLLHLDGRSLLLEPYDVRREQLGALSLGGDSWQVSPVFSGPGANILAASREQGMEGVLAKRRDSIYEPGKRTKAWFKIKHVRMQEIVIGGWRPGNGRRAGKIGSLILGLPEQGKLRYIGQVGTGFTEALLADLGTRLARLQRKSSPFATELPSAVRRDAHWVSPRLVGEVAFTEWTPDALLRHPSWRGLRPAKSPADVRPE